MTRYWVEMSLIHSGDDDAVDRLVATIDQLHDGQTVFTAAGPNLTLALVDDSSEGMGDVVSRLLQLVYSTAAELGFSTLGLADPIRIANLQVTSMEAMAVSA